jgi:plastocyanin
MRRRALLALLALPALASAEPSGRVTGQVTITADGAAKADRSGVVVYLDGVASGGAGPPAERPRVKQQDQQFAPRVTVVEKGGVVEFPNEDKVFHNVFSMTEGAKFDLGLYKSGESKTVTFKRPGVVDVYCNIHPNMVAKVKVVDSGFHAVTGADGHFVLADVPPGTYPLVAWQAAGAEWRGEVTVKAGEAVEVTVPLVEGKADTSHTRKDGTPYGRYK